MTITSILQRTPLDRLDTEILLAYVLGVDRTHIKAHPQRRLSLVEHLRFFYVAWLRKRNTPIAYITGHKDFYGLDFEVNKHTLVPRPETEQLVSLTLDQVKSLKSKIKSVLLIDIGTGSGCIPISILHGLKNHPVHSLQSLATDISKQALKTAERNAKKHNVNITFVHGNLLEPILSHVPRDTWLTSRVIITANLPYITEDQWHSEESIKKEPKSALVAGEQGLALYRELLEQLQTLTPNLQSPTTLYFEIDPDQKELIEPLVKKSFPNARVILHNDLCGRARIVTIKLL